VTITRYKIQLVDVSGKGARGRIQQGTAANRINGLYTAFQAIARSAAIIHPVWFENGIVNRNNRNDLSRCRNPIAADGVAS
jgi:hypothetical protein